MDIVRIFESYCNDNDIAFYYGSNAHLNLIEGSLDVDKIYFLMFPPKRSNVVNDNKTRIKGTTYNGKFLLVVNGDYAQHYFNENGTNPSDSKFTENVEPLLQAFNNAGNYILSGCGLDLDLQLWENDDAINVLDANKDGLWCTYRIYTDE